MTDMMTDEEMVAAGVAVARRQWPLMMRVRACWAMSGRGICVSGEGDKGKIIDLIVNGEHVALTKFTESHPVRSAPLV